MVCLASLPVALIWYGEAMSSEAERIPRRHPASVVAVWEIPGRDCDLDLHTSPLPNMSYLAFGSTSTYTIFTI